MALQRGILGILWEFDTVEFYEAMVEFLPPENSDEFLRLRDRTGYNSDELVTDLEVLLQEHALTARTGADGDWRRKPFSNLGLSVLGKTLMHSEMPHYMASARGVELSHEDPARRTRRLRREMLSWLYRSDTSDRAEPGWISFTVNVMRGQFTIREVWKQARWLEQSGYAVARSSGRLDPRITPAGEDALASGGLGAEGEQMVQPGQINNYGPVIHGNADNSQFAYGNRDVQQAQLNAKQEVAAGYEELFKAVGDTLRQLPAMGLPEGDAEGARKSAEEILAEVVEPKPDKGKIKKALAAVLGFLSPVALGISAGAGDGAKELATEAVKQLSGVLF